MRKIVLTGPESSGKTSLAIDLSIHYKTRWVPEYARYYINHLNREYDQRDLSKIGKGQIEIEESQVALATDYLFCDTDLLTIQIWSEVKYGTVDPWILTEIGKRSCDTYFLCRPDLPWSPDPQREHPEEREQLFERYERLLNQLGKNYVIVEGMNRMDQAVQALEANEV